MKLQNSFEGKIFDNLDHTSVNNIINLISWTFKTKKNQFIIYKNDISMLYNNREKLQKISDIGIGYNGNNVVKGQHYLENLRSKSKFNNDYQSTINEEDYDPNRKF